MQLPCCQIPLELYSVPLKPLNVKSVEYHKLSNRFILAKLSCVSFNSPSICEKTSVGLAMSYFRSSKPHYTHSALKFFISSAWLRPEHSLPSTSRLNVHVLPDSASRFLLRRFYTNSVQDFKAFNRPGSKGKKVWTFLEARANNTSELIRGESVVSSGGALGCSLISSFAPGCASSTDVGSDAAAEVMFKGESNEANGLKQAQALTAVETALGTPFSNSPQVPPPKPLVIVISGPSGVGKDAVIKRLQEVRREFHFVVTATTRPKRPGEVDGIDYFFVTKDEFQKLIHDKELLEFALVYGDYKGIPKQQVRDCISKGLDAVLRVDVQGAATVRSMLGSNAVFIFLVAESEVALVKRLAERKTESIDKLVLRIATAREELKRLQEFDYVVVNADGQLEKTVNTICCIIDAEKARVLQRTVTI